MQDIQLHLEPDEGPEAAETTGEPLAFDPRDPQSMRKTQKILRERFHLTVAPPLCNDPGSRLLRALRQQVASALRFVARAARFGRILGQTTA